MSVFFIDSSKRARIAAGSTTSRDSRKRLACSPVRPCYPARIRRGYYGVEPHKATYPSVRPVSYQLLVYTDIFRSLKATPAWRLGLDNAIAASYVCLLYT